MATSDRLIIKIVLCSMSLSARGPKWVVGHPDFLAGGSNLSLKIENSKQHMLWTDQHCFTVILALEVFLFLLAILSLLGTNMK